ncbi:MAG TPA: hypothetical protein PLW81_01990 [Thiobacillaceae bacterium]|nr:hypothetical protein [Thiobacillaceae bacterium]
MRISTYVYMNASLAGIQQQQSGIARLSSQLAADKRILQPKDDPLAAGRAMDLSASIARRTQYAVNQQQAQLALAEEQTVLGGLADTLDQVKSVLLGGISAANDLPLRQRYATEMAGLYLQVKDLANAQDSSGRYLFAGYRNTAASLAPNSQPFNHTQTVPPSPPASSPATTYAGDANSRSVNINGDTRLRVSDDLNATVMRSGTAGADLLQLLDQLTIDLNDPNLTQATLNTHLSAIQTVVGNLELIEADIAARQIQLEEVSKTNQSLLNLDKDALGKIQELDQAAAIVQLRQRETALQAAEQAFARTAELSLFSFL